MKNTNESKAGYRVSITVLKQLEGADQTITEDVVFGNVDEFDCIKNEDPFKNEYIMKMKDGKTYQINEESYMALVLLQSNVELEKKFAYGKFKFDDIYSRIKKPEDI